MRSLLHSGGIIVVSLFAAALSPCGVSAFCLHGRQAAARAKTTVIAYVENPDAKEERTRISVLEERLKEAEAKTMNVQFEMIAGKIDAMNKDLNVKFDATNSKIDTTNGKIDAVARDLNVKIDAVARDLDGKIDATNGKIDANTKDLNVKIDAIKTEIGRNQLATTTEIGKTQMGLVAVACVSLAQMLPSILTFLK
jgi:galactitol-specific phosphotransferase system IIB component